MFVVALPGGHATLAPWVVGDVCQAVLSEFVRGHALWALSRPRCPAFFNFLFVITLIPQHTAYPRHTRTAVYSKEILTRAWSAAQVPWAWAYGFYASCIRSLRQRKTTLVKEIVLLLWDPIAQ